MILRNFATDGLTPFPIFRRSIEDTAALCPQQVLWVTRTDTPLWKEEVDWFIRQPMCRAVVVDTADRWEWYQEHEVTIRIVRGLYYDQEEKIEAVCWCHDDMAPPASPEFHEWIKRWLESESTLVTGDCFQFWDSFDLVRADGTPPFIEPHGWIAKFTPDLSWLSLRGSRKKQPQEEWERFLTVGRINPWVCPWPFRHYKGVDEAFRTGFGTPRRGFCKRWGSPQEKAGADVRVISYDPNMKWDDFIKIVEEGKK